MKTYTGKILRSESNLSGQIAIALKESKSGIKRDWEGSFLIPPGSGIQTGDYQIALTDGRVGRIKISYLAATSDGQWVANFLGDSELAHAPQVAPNKSSAA